MSITSLAKNQSGPASVQRPSLDRPFEAVHPHDTDPAVLYEDLGACQWVVDEIQQWHHTLLDLANAGGPGPAWNGVHAEFTPVILRDALKEGNDVQETAPWENQAASVNSRPNSSQDHRMEDLQEVSLFLRLLQNYVNGGGTMPGNRQ